MAVFRRISILALALVGAAGCASLSQGMKETSSTVQSIPDWYSKPPSTKNEYYGVGTFESPSLSMASAQAEASGRASVARQLSVDVTQRQRSFEDQAGIGKEAEVLSQAQVVFKQFSAEVLVGARLKEQKVVPKDGTYLVYALVEMPTDGLAKALQTRLNAEKALKSRVESTKAYEELDAEVKARAWAKKP